jgi:hypothetical protein
MGFVKVIQYGNVTERGQRKLEVSENFCDEVEFRLRCA